VIKKLVIGTRASKLALWQANYVAGRIKDHYPEVEVVLKNIVTTGDKVLDVPLAKIGGKGLFTKELEKELLSGEIDLAVHSLKDMPTELPAGLALGVISERTDIGDALVSIKYTSINSLPCGARIGTSSLRRKAQLLNYRPDLVVQDLRGNIDTRLAKLANTEFDAIVLAVAGLKRLKWEQYITQVLPEDICLPAVGQGALAIEIRTDDQAVLSVIDFLHHRPTALAVAAERAFLSELEGGCQVPIGVHSHLDDGVLHISAVILSVDGRQRLAASISGQPRDSVVMGRKLARQMYDNGGREILASLREGEGKGHE